MRYLRENTTRARVITTTECCSWPYLLTNAAFVLSPFSESPLHFSQNFNSSFFKVAGDLPHREDPGLSSSVSWQAAICAKSKWKEKFPYWPRLHDLACSIKCNKFTFPSLVRRNVCHVTKHMEQGLAVVSHLLMTVHTWCQEEFIFHAKKQAIKPTADWK